MSYPHRKPITAAEFREIVSRYRADYTSHYEKLIIIADEHAEHIALALEAMEERANSEVM